MNMQWDVFGKVVNVYCHDYGPNYKWVTNSSCPTLEAHVAKFPDFYKDGIENYVAFPDAYNNIKELVPGSIAICRKLS